MDADRQSRPGGVGANRQSRPGGAGADRHPHPGGVGADRQSHPGVVGGRRAGFSLLELLITLAILGIVVNIAVPVMLSAQQKAAAGRILADVDMIHDAVLAYRLENGSYPDTAGWGQMPGGLAPYLPTGFSFVNGGVRYRYQLQQNAKRIGIDAGNRDTTARDVVARAAAMFIGRKAVAARRVWLWLPSPGGRRE